MASFLEQSFVQLLDPILVLNSKHNENMGEYSEMVVIGEQAFDTWSL